MFFTMCELTPNASNFQSSNFHDIRDVLIKKKNSVKELKDFVVILKPSDECTYRNVVDILDEMTINVCTRYALVDITDTETKLIQISEQNAASTANK